MLTSKGKCGYIHRMAKANVPLPFVGALQDESAVDRMCLYLTSGDFEGSVVHVTWMW